MLFFKQHSRLAFILHIFIIGLVSQQAYAYTPVEIIKSPNDQRQYRGLVLDNGLKVLLVSDPEAEKAAAALNVGVGSFSEPAEHQGLAHFLEHMLFLGTEKYPKDNDYSEYIASHGGSTNAWTQDRNTQYYFDVIPEHLPGAIDRFAQFFIAPLFNADLVDRERHAVDSEYNLGLKQDGWRIREVSHTTSNPLHPIKNFSMGNLATLGDKPQQKPVRESLIEFHKNYYNSDRMTLAVVAPQSLNDLENMVRENFSAVPKNAVQKVEIDTLAYTENETAEKISVKTLGDYQQISLGFPIPSQQNEYENLSINFILTHFQQTGPKSLYQVLKKKNWINELSASNDSVTYAQDLANIDLSLTNAGMGHIDEIVQYVFAYIDYMKKIGPQQSWFDDLQKSGERNFQYTERIDPMSYASMLPMAMQHYPLQKVLIAGNFNKNTQFMPQKITKLLTYFTPQNMRMLVVNKNIVGEQVEEKYNVAYSVSKFTPEQMQNYLTPADDAWFAVPGSNRFMPENFSLRSAIATQAAEAIPQQVLNEFGMSLWYKQDQTFKLPKQNIIFLFSAPKLKDSARNALLATLMQYSVTDRMSELSDECALAGVNIDFSVNKQGAVLSISMFSDKALEVLRTSLKYMQDISIDAQQFLNYKQEVTRALQNFKQQDPYQQARVILNSIAIKEAWLPQDLVAEINSVTKKDLELYTRSFLQQLQIEALLHGNITKEDATILVKAVAEQLQVDPKAASGFVLPQLVQIPNGSSYHYAFESEHGDSVLASYYQAQTADDKTIAINSLFNQIISQPLYNQLRTKEQLGYVAFVTPMRVRERTGLCFCIESPVKDSSYINKRLAMFNQGFINSLAKFSEQDFANYKASLHANLLEKPSSLAEETARYWNKIIEGTYRFNFNREIADQLSDVKLADVSEYSKKLLLNPKTARNIAIVNSDKKRPFKQGKKINTIAEFKKKANFAEESVKP